MKSLKTITAALCVATLVSSCATNQGTYSAGGAGAGAVLGGIVGNIIGKNTKGTAIGAAIGAAVGAGTGALIGRHMDKVKQQTQAQVDNAKVETVKDANGLSCVKVTLSCLLPTVQTLMYRQNTTLRSLLVYLDRTATAMLPFKDIPMHRATTILTFRFQSVVPKPFQAICVRKVCLLDRFAQ